jgi:hypothetical protein
MGGFAALKARVAARATASSPAAMGVAVPGGLSGLAALRARLAARGVGTGGNLGNFIKLPSR